MQSGIRAVPVQQYSTHSPDSCLPLLVLLKLTLFPDGIQFLSQLKFQNAKYFLRLTSSLGTSVNSLFLGVSGHISSPGQPNLFPRGGYNFNGRINSALEGRRNVGGAMIALAIANVENIQVALSKLQSLAIRRLSFPNGSEKHNALIKSNRPWWDLEFKEVFNYKDLIFLLIRRDFVTSYKQAILGPLWIILQALLGGAVFTVVFGKIANISTDGHPAFLFYLCGMLSWQYFSSVYRLDVILQSNLPIFFKYTSQD